MRKRVQQTMAAVAVIAIAAIVSMLPKQGSALIINLVETGDTAAELALTDGKFSVSFIHSVNKSPYTDYYEVKNGEIYAVASRFYSFGAGVETWPVPGGIAVNMEDGSIYATGDPIKIDKLIYIVGSVSDHILEIGEEEYSLTELCGKSAAVEFIIEKRER